MMDMQKNTDRSAVEMELDELMNISGGVPSLETQKRALMNDMRSAKASGKTFDEWIDSVPGSERIPEASAVRDALERKWKYM